ncbi:MAG: 6-phosphofructokinase [Nanoarchaeota archaeon]|nr:6-phosphofructokinase [Nanoarchaeota archaeon]MBU1004921.1 6-phosphofructokinase [Nanoarchaeota archaeon]MBU1945633.1 6-phosphofructokinase [Nanoarchaeota archaeon]
MAVTGKKGKQIAVLTGGGDAPGLNAVIRGIVVKAKSLGYDVLGILDGWKGLLDCSHCGVLDLDQVSDIHMLGGTILHTSRTNPYKVENGPQKVKDNLKKLNCDFLIAIGGEDTLGVANKLFKEGVKVVGVPKTIDNDLNETDYTFGFNTAITRATESIQNLHTTAKSHHRTIVVEIMGRHAGWMTLESGIAGGASVILLPEEPFDLNEICNILKNRKKKGKNYAIIACSEGAVPKEGQMILQTGEKDAFGHVRLGGIAERLSEEIEKRTGIECRHVVLGHLQRAGDPTVFDRVLGTRLGVKAADMIDKREFGKMAALKGIDIIAVDLNKAVGKLKTVPKERFDEAKLFFETD